MSTTPRLSRLGPAVHPGEMLREEFLIPLGMSAEVLAKEIKVPEQHVIAILKEQQMLDGDMCLRLARYFRMSPEFWMGIDKDYELATAMKEWSTICKEVPQRPKAKRT